MDSVVRTESGAEIGIQQSKERMYCSFDPVVMPSARLHVSTIELYSGLPSAPSPCERNFAGSPSAIYPVDWSQGDFSRGRKRG
jgi:hypothetical protein